MAVRHTASIDYGQARTNLSVVEMVTWTIGHVSSVDQGYGKDYYECMPDGKFVQ